MLKILVKRIEVSERAAVGRLKFAEDCICFSAEKSHRFSFQTSSRRRHFQVKCPLQWRSLRFSSLTLGTRGNGMEQPRRATQESVAGQRPAHSRVRRDRSPMC
jgi:hypothetical protein